MRKFAQSGHPGGGHHFADGLSWLLGWQILYFKNPKAQFG
jgi:hypothetical protein